MIWSRWVRRPWKRPVQQVRAHVFRWLFGDRWQPVQLRDGGNNHRGGLHDDATDALLLRDPKPAPAVCHRAAMHAVIKFMNQFDTNNPRARVSPEPDEPARHRGNKRANRFRVDRAGQQWRQSARRTMCSIARPTVSASAIRSPSVTSRVTPFPINGGVDYYFRVTAANTGGESMPSETVGCRAATTNNAPRSGGERLRSHGSFGQSASQSRGGKLGSAGKQRHDRARLSALEQRLRLRHRARQGDHSGGWAFDSCQNEAVANNQVTLSNYAIVIWAAAMNPPATKLSAPPNKRGSPPIWLRMARCSFRFGHRL